jgi:mono/diheme cytochrome c family protein
MPRAALAISSALAVAATILPGCGSHVRTANHDRYDSGRRIFVEAGCGGCHTSAAAGTHGTTGPDFDTSEVLSRAQIRSQLDLGVGGMPSFRSRLTPQEKADVAYFLAAALRNR